MNWPHIHLIINHFPVIGLFLTLLLFGLAFFRKSDELMRVAVGALVFLALTAIPVYFTGQAAADTVKKLPGVTEGVVGTHQEVASLALVLIEGLGAAALGGLIFFRRSPKIPTWFAGAVLGLTLATAALLGLTANLGGQIRHQEIREGFVPPPASGPAKHDAGKEIK